MANKTPMSNNAPKRVTPAVQEVLLGEDYNLYPPRVKKLLASAEYAMNLEDLKLFSDIEAFWADVLHPSKLVQLNYKLQNPPTIPVRLTRWDRRSKVENWWSDHLTEQAPKTESNAIDVTPVPLETAISEGYEVDMSQVKKVKRGGKSIKMTYWVNGWFDRQEIDPKELEGLTEEHKHRLINLLLSVGWVCNQGYIHIEEKSEMLPIYLSNTK